MSNATEASALNVIQQGTEIEGTIKCAGNIRIDGYVKGNIFCEGKVVIGTAGKIDGNVVCKSVDIAGNMKGELTAKELATLLSTAHFEGNLMAMKLAIEEGAFLLGECNMDKRDSKTDSKIDQAVEIKADKTAQK